MSYNLLGTIRLRHVYFSKELFHNLPYRIPIDVYLLCDFLFNKTSGLRPILFTVALRFLEMMIVRVDLTCSYFRQKDLFVKWCDSRINLYIEIYDIRFILIFLTFTSRPLVQGDLIL